MNMYVYFIWICAASSLMPVVSTAAHDITHPGREKGGVFQGGWLLIEAKITPAMVNGYGKVRCKFRKLKTHHSV